jgi:5'-nucleotidase
MEGRFLGFPAVAVSLVLDEGQHFATAGAVTRKLVEQMTKTPLPRDSILSINVPDLPLQAIDGFRATRLGFRHKSEPVVKARDPKNQPIYWIGPAGPGQDAGPGTDFHAIGEGCVSVTPIKVDLTNHAAIAGLGSWLGGLA